MPHGVVQPNLASLQSPVPQVIRYTLEIPRSIRREPHPQFEFVASKQKWHSWTTFVCKDNRPCALSDTSATDLTPHRSKPCRQAQRLARPHRGSRSIDSQSDGCADWIPPLLRGGAGPDKVSRLGVLLRLVSGMRIRYNPRTRVGSRPADVCLSWVWEPASQVVSFGSRYDKISSGRHRVHQRLDLDGGEPGRACR